MSEATDDELVAAAGRGDALAFSQLVGRHAPRLLALVARVFGDRAGAEDVVQEVFVRAWTQAPRWRPSGSDRASYAAWLARVAVNLAIDGRRRYRPTTPLDAVADPADPAAPPEAALLGRERAAHLRAAIAALPERQRVAIALAYDADLPNATAAAAMSVSVGAYELLLVRARRALRAAMQDA